MGTHLSSQSCDAEEVIDVTIGIILAVVIGLLLVQTRVLGSGALHDLTHRLVDWCDGRPWRAALLLTLGVEAPLLMFLLPGLPGPQATVWATLGTGLATFGFMWALMSWFMRRQSDEQGHRD